MVSVCRVLSHPAGTPVLKILGGDIFLAHHPTDVVSRGPFLVVLESCARLRLFRIVTNPPLGRNNSSLEFNGAANGARAVNRIGRLARWLTSWESG